MPKKGASFYARLAANVFSPLPYAVAGHNSRPLRQKIAQMARSGEFDLWQFEWMAYADAVTGVPGTRSLLIAHNVESLIWKRYCQTEKSPAKRLYLQQQYRKFRRYERKLMRSVSGVVCVSEDDARLAREGFSPRKAWVVDNGIDRDFFAAAQAQRDPHNVLFLGSLEWRPNLDALRVLIDDVFPRVLSTIPTCQLTIVGRNPPQWLRAVADALPHITLHANVPDVRTYLASATVMAVPLRVGGGSRLKILEALACGLPVVSTAVGAEGLALRPDEQIRIADTPADIAAGLVWAIRNQESARQMAEAGRKLVYERYDWDVLARRLNSIWQEITRQESVAPVGVAQGEPALG